MLLTTATDLVMVQRLMKAVAETSVEALFDVLPVPVP